MSSRKNLCVHNEIRHERFGKAVDAKCRELTASFVRAANDDGASKCDFFNGWDSTGKEKPIPPGVYTIQSMKEYGEAKGYCPYFMARYSISHANVVVYSYHYLLDPKIAELVSKEMGKDSVVVFDEAYGGHDLWLCLYVGLLCGAPVQLLSYGGRVEHPIRAPRSFGTARVPTHADSAYMLR